MCKFSVLCDLFDHPFNDFPGEMKVTDNDRKDGRTDRRRTQKREERWSMEMCFESCDNVSDAADTFVFVSTEKG